MAFEDEPQPLIEGDRRAEAARQFPTPAVSAGEQPTGTPATPFGGSSPGGGYGYPPPLNGSYPGSSGDPAPGPYAGYGAGAPPYGQPPSAAMHELRPLSTGEILDRTFTLYRSRFWLFAGISALAAVVQVLSAGAQMVGFHGMMRLPLAGVPRAQLSVTLMHSFEAVLVSYAAALIYFLAASVTQAATAWALGEVYLGRAAEVGTAMRVGGRRWGTFVLIALWQIFSFLWVPMVVGMLAVGAAALLAIRGGFAAVWMVPVLLVVGVIGGMVFGAIRYLMNSLAIPASVEEGLPVRASMRRSKNLTAGIKGRIFLVLLVVWAMYLVAGVLQAPLSLLWLRAPSQSHVIAQVVMLLIGFVAHTVVAPVMMIGLTLVYFDQRVRREAFDLVMLMNEAAGVGTIRGPAAAGEMGHADLG